MRILRNQTCILVLFASAFWATDLSAQTGNITLMQDPKFEQLLNEKRKINASITINDRYKIQIFSGESENAKKALAEFRKNSLNYDGTIVFNTPVYKVWIGNFKTELKPNATLLSLKKYIRMRC
jgi:hypothetical protein